jgi:hypothetical protein
MARKGTKLKLYLCGVIGNGKSWRDEIKDKEAYTKRFNSIESLLISFGYEVWNPIRQVQNPKNRKDAIKQDMLGLFECDGIALIDEFISNGMAAEIAVGKSINIEAKPAEKWIKLAKINK